MEFIGTVQFFDKTGKRMNPTALYLERTDNGECRISARLPQGRLPVGVGATANKAAGDFEIKLKAVFSAPGAYDGPSWNGIKAEKPAPPKVAPPATPKSTSSVEPQSDVVAPADKVQAPVAPDPAIQSSGSSSAEEATNPV